MALHAIVLQKENTEVGERVAKHYRFHYPLNDQCFLVRTDDISETVAKNVGIKGDKQVPDVAGAVFKLNGTYSGYAASSLWEWIAIKEGT